MPTIVIPDQRTWHSILKFFVLRSLGGRVAEPLIAGGGGGGSSNFSPVEGGGCY